MRRAVQLAATMVITAVLTVGIASADSVNSKNAQFITLNCGEPLQVVTIAREILHEREPSHEQVSAS
jgi:hypothetical protein